MKTASSPSLRSGAIVFRISVIWSWVNSSRVSAPRRAHRHRGALLRGSVADHGAHAITTPRPMHHLHSGERRSRVGTPATVTRPFPSQSAHSSSCIPNSR